MYIEPNTNIRLLRNCPCDPDFTNTLYFGSKSAQSNYFISLTKYNLSNYSYQRVNKGVLRAGIQAENLYDCNYMMFQNSAFGNKWFYAFIDRIEYVNNTMSEVYFTIDPMQTWLTDFTLNQTFVEREHSVTDVVGENLVPENVNLGEYTIEEVDHPNQWNDFERVIVIGSTDWYDGEEWHEGTGAGIRGSIFCGIHFEVVRGADEYERIRKASDYIAEFSESGRVDSILGVWETYYQYLLDVGYTGNIQTWRTNSIHSYTPKNKKLLTYPYKFLEGASPDGNRHTYMYEYFPNPEQATFFLRGTFNGTASLIMYPYNYKGANPNYDEAMGYDGASVQCAYTTDSFKAWLAQNSYNINIGATQLQLPKNAIGNIISGGQRGARIGGTVGMVAGETLGALGTIADIMQKEGVMANHGRMGSGSAVNHILKNDMFRIYRKAITEEFAIKIDEYFNKYGYATNNIKVPNINSRPHWNFVKTIGCTINGSIPSDDEKRICSIFDSGITFWKNGSEVGNYSLNNSPT